MLQSRKRGRCLSMLSVRGPQRAPVPPGLGLEEVWVEDTVPLPSPGARASLPCTRQAPGVLVSHTHFQRVSMTCRALHASYTGVMLILAPCSIPETWGDLCFLFYEEENESPCVVLPRTHQTVKDLQTKFKTLDTES